MVLPFTIIHIETVEKAPLEVGGGLIFSTASWMNL